MEIVPTDGLSDQLTPVFVVPLTEILNCAEAPAAKLTALGVIARVTGATGGTKETLDVADFVGSAALVAFTTTVCAELIVAGAV